MNRNSTKRSLRGANFRGAGLDRRRFINKDLTDADFSHSYIFRASFKGSNLTGTNFDRANGVITASFKDVIGAIAFPHVGSRGDTLLVIKYPRGGLRFRTGCFWGNEREFRSQVWSTHGQGIYGKEYRECIKKAKEALK